MQPYFYINSRNDPPLIKQHNTRTNSSYEEFQFLVQCNFIILSMEVKNLHLDLIFKHTRRAMGAVPLGDASDLRSKLTDLFDDLNCNPIAFRKEFSERLYFIDNCSEAQEDLRMLFESNPTSLCVVEESIHFLKISCFR